MVLKELILTVSTLGGCGGHERTHWSFIEKISLKQDPKPQVCSNFQMSFLQLSQRDPPVEASGGQD